MTTTATEELKETIIEQLKTQKIVRIPASEADFFALSDELPFKIEYHESEIVTMGLTTPWHEVLVANLIVLLNAAFSLENSVFVLGSNAGVQIPKFEGGYYLPDITVVRGAFELKEGSNCILTNPYIVVEVLSKSTAKYDRGDKLPEYKHLESLQQIILVNQDKMEVESYTRTDKPNTWLNQTFTEAEETLTVHQSAISLKDIYRKIEFSK